MEGSGFSLVDGKTCAWQPAVGEVLYAAGERLRQGPDSGDAVALAVGSEVEVLAVDDGWAHVRTPAGEGWLAVGEVTPHAGDAYRRSNDTEVPWAVGIGEFGPRLVIPGGAVDVRVDEPPKGGELVVRVERWGDMEPLFVVEICDDDGCRSADVSFVGDTLQQLGEPGAYAFAPKLLDDDPDCEAASVLAVQAETPAPRLELLLPPWRGDAPDPVVCSRVGRAAADPFVVCQQGERRVGFVEKEEARWERVSCGSDLDLELDRLLQHKRIQVVERGDLRWDRSALP